MQRKWMATGGAVVLTVALSVTFVNPAAQADPIEDKFVGMHYSTWFGDDYPWYKAWDPESFEMNFEDNTPYGLDWFAAGDAFGVAPTATTHGSLAGWGGSKWGDSIVSGETKTGALVSRSFVVDGTTLTFKAAGYDGPSGGASLNKYELRRTSDGALLRSAAPPQSDAFTTVSWNVSDLASQSVYFQAVDKQANTGWAWVAVDDVAVGSTHLNFETQGYSRWRATGSAFGNGPMSTAHGGLSGYQKLRWADSFRGGETATGTLESKRFTVDGGAVRFKAAGWDGYSGGAGTNFYRLVSASDNSVLFSTPAPQSDAFTEITWDVSGLGATEVYFEIVDGNSGTSYAWLAADHVIYDKNPITVEPVEGFYTSDDVDVAKNHAATLGEMGVDFLMFDESNNTIWGPDHPQAEYQSDALYDGALAAAEAFATVPGAPKATMMFSITTWDSDQTRVQRDITQNYDTGTPYMYYPWIPSNSGDLWRAKIGELYTDLAHDDEKYFYYNDKPLLFLYVAGGGTVYDENNVDQTPDGKMPSTWNPVIPGTGGQGVRDVFEIRWVSALMSGSNNAKLLDLPNDPSRAKNGHWSYVDKTPQTWASVDTPSGPVAESVVVSPNGDGTEPRDGGNTYRAQWERALDLDPTFVTISQWNSFSTSGDERSAEYSASIEPTTNYFGDYYKVLTEEYIAEFKGLTP